MSDRVWREVSLGDVLELKRGYDLPARDRIPGSVPLVSSSGITYHHAVSMAKGPGVVTGRYGTLGEVFFIPQDFWPLNTTLYVRDFKGNDPRFISYFLRSLDFRAYSDKAAVPGLNRNHLHLARVRGRASRRGSWTLIPCVPRPRDAIPVCLRTSAICFRIRSKIRSSARSRRSGVLARSTKSQTWSTELRLRPPDSTRPGPVAHWFGFAISETSRQESRLPKCIQRATSSSRATS